MYRKLENCIGWLTIARISSTIQFHSQSAEFFLMFKPWLNISKAFLAEQAQILPANVWDESCKSTVKFSITNISPSAGCCLSGSVNLPFSLKCGSWWDNINHFKNSCCNGKSSLLSSRCLVSSRNALSRGDSTLHDETNEQLRRRTERTPKDFDKFSVSLWKFVRKFLKSHRKIQNDRNHPHHR